MSDFNIEISTENGTGSMTANKILLRSLLKEGFFASSKNLFPSNIAGLPTTFKIRLSAFSQSGSGSACDLYVGFNKKTFVIDTQNLSQNVFCIYNENFKIEPQVENKLGLDCRKAVKELHPSVGVRKLLQNMLYVGSVLKLLGCSFDNANSVSRKFFGKLSEDLVEANINALRLGFESCESLLKNKIEHLKTNDSKNYLFEGNHCSALGFLDGGATVVTWYPITPSSSVAESFESMNSFYFGEKQNLRSVLQCEDEISSAIAALGAGWSGARSFTATSGPGLSLMQEAIGLGYFTETPFVILDVQRAGPSTGLPTRTSQADLLLAHYSSHGDSLHPVLLPGTPQEAYDFSFDSLNLSHELQTPVLILSDLDLGMNEWLTHEPILQRTQEINDGKVQLEATDQTFKRYSNIEDVPVRSLPRLSDSSLSYFTRGSGHDEAGRYSEDPEVYSKKLQRLKDKVLNSKNNKTASFPEDLIRKSSDKKVCVVTWGSTGQIEDELRDLLDFEFSYIRLRSLPVSEESLDFINQHHKVFVVEQNRDGQMNKILKSNSKMGLQSQSICFFDGHPIKASKVADSIKGGL